MCTASLALDLVINLCLSSQSGISEGKVIQSKTDITETPLRVRSEANVE